MGGPEPAATPKPKAGNVLAPVVQEANTFGIPTKVVNDAFSDGSVSLGTKSFPGAKSASYSSDKKTVFIDKKFFKDGKVDMDNLSKDQKSSVLVDTLHEAMHAVWQKEGYDDVESVGSELKGLAQKAKTAYDSRIKGKTLPSLQHGLDIVEEAISGIWSTILTDAHRGTDSMMNRHLGNYKNGYCSKEEAENGFYNSLDGMERRIRRTFAGTGSGYSNDEGTWIWQSGYNETIPGIDIGDFGRRFIEKHLFGKSLDEFIKAWREKVALLFLDRLLDEQVKKMKKGQKIAHEEEAEDSVAMSAWPDLDPVEAPTVQVAVLAPVCTQQVLTGCAAFAAVEAKRSSVRTGATRGITVKVPPNLGVGTRHARRPAVRGGGMRCGR
ncbi:MAG: hypothetical protein ACYTGH_11795 [Planctomycetota bacterium]